MIRVLLIDDEPDLLVMVKLFLEQDGDLEVTTAESAQEGLRFLAASRFDAIVCDYMMPGMNGIELLKTLRGMDLTIPIIIFTGKGNEEVVIEALNNGADFYLQKGSDPREKMQQLQQMIRDAVVKRQTTSLIVESEKKYRALVQYAPIGILATDAGGNVVDSNPLLMSILGTDTEEDVKKINVLTYPPMVKSGILVDFEHCLQSGEGGTFEHYYVNEKGKKIFLRYRIRPLYAGKKKISGILAALEDFTEWKSMEEALKQANKKLSLLSSVTRHDINNQLTILLGNLELMKHDRMDESMREFIEKEEVAAERIKNQIRFNKDYQDIGVHSPQWQNLSSTLNKALMTLNLGKIRLSLDLPEIEIYANPLLEKVFFNLFNNSIRTEGVRTIALSARKEGRAWVLIYQDDGPGVEKDEKELIFEREYGKVAGYGLFVSREILSITDISIRETGEPGEGVRFELWVPEHRYRVAGKPGMK
ncbi:PAS domain S-box-containing protein [Methanolinea mesophila]|uniref:ATP-binding response regulator n=1 Tax=Methanolinea mesophila TaxID=547055 RepID=UPI001AE518EE|nr:hybrid sensor histidine kinase/response regulator [Methanolinea mesophila]MBP1927664.1 PAS domain S-box-containing protein [Methanolinea mesophila]